MNCLLEVRNLAVDIGQFQILQDISFNVPEHEITVLLGRNGAGKTTTLRTIMGFQKPKSGTIHYREQSLSEMATHRIQRMGIGYVPEDANVFANLTVAENLRLSGHHKDNDAQAVLDTFPDLRAAWAKSAGTLSGGQKQMLAIACVLMTKPPLMLIDEPTKGLSPMFVERVAEVFLALKGTTTILLVEQNFYLAQHVGQHYVLVDDGRTVCGGAMEELVASVDLQQKYLGLRVGGGSAANVRISDADV